MRGKKKHGGSSTNFKLLSLTLNIKFDAEILCYVEITFASLYCLGTLL